MSGSGRAGYVMAMCAGGLVVWGVMVHGAEPVHHAVEPVQVVAAPVPASAYECAVRCPGYVPPDESYHPAPSFVKPVIPTNGVVTVYLPAPVAAAHPTRSQPGTTVTVTKKTSTTGKGTTTSTTTKTTTRG
jgi:hypothetical protein